MSEHHGKIWWSELVVPDAEKVAGYYAETMGWEISEMPMPEGPYHICNHGGQAIAGIMDIKQLPDANIPPHWMTYLAVADIDAVVAALPGKGGAVVRPPFEVPGVGRIAILRDPGGATVGMMTPAAEAPA